MTLRYVDGVHLHRTDENIAEIAGLAQRLGTTVGLTGVLADLNRTGRRVDVPGRAPVEGFTWNEQDADSEAWWPQGISTTADASPDGAIDSRRLLVVTWYSKRREGSRITFVDLDTLRYRHVVVVDPREDRVRPLRIHAGGIVWAGDHVHLAGTARGLFSCRLDDIMKVEPSEETWDYRYVLPVRFAYRARTDEGVTALRYSFLSLDRGSDPPSLVAGEYGVAGQTTRLVRYPLDPETMLLRRDEEGRSRPVYLNDGGVGHMQGAACIGSTYYVTVSRGPRRLGYLYRGSPGSLRPRRWALPAGPEDIAYWPAEDRLWSLTEYPGHRFVFAMDRTRLRLLPHLRWGVLGRPRSTRRARELA